MQIITSTKKRNKWHELPQAWKYMQPEFPFDRSKNEAAEKKYI